MDLKNIKMDKNKEYKLVKDFPGRKIGDIIYWAEEPVERWFWKSGGCIPPDLTRDLQGLPKLEEWFEEVVEKEYEILSFRTSQDSGNSWQISRRISNGRFLWDKFSEKDLPLRGVTDGDGMGATEEYMLTEWLDDSDYQRCEINSIRRKSDGEIFTVGDRVDENVASNNKYAWTISEFSLKDNRCFTCGVNINYIKKVKEILFVTFDGIEITDPGQLVWVLHTNYNALPYTQTFKNAYMKHKHLNCILFDKEAAAKNYIKCHKPVLSYNDVSAMLINGYGTLWYRENFKKELTKLVESKL